MLILTAEDVLAALPMKDAIAGMKRAYAALSHGRVRMPGPVRVAVPEVSAEVSTVPVLVKNPEGEALAVKTTAVFPDNALHGIPIVQTAVLVLDPGTGRIDALIEGTMISAIRTGAGAGVATALLARENARTVSIFGAGRYAAQVLRGVCAVRRIERVLVHSPHREVTTFAGEVAGFSGVPDDIRVTSDVPSATSRADIICTVTSSATPVFADRDVRPGTHINGIGSFRPSMAEIPHLTIARSLLVVDSRSHALAEAGDIIQPILAGQIPAGHIHAEIGELISGDRPGRTSADQVTCFKSIGLAAQDAVAATIVLRNARAMGLGVRVRF